MYRRLNISDLPLIHVENRDSISISVGHALLAEKVSSSKSVPWDSETMNLFSVYRCFLRTDLFPPFPIHMERGAEERKNRKRDRESG